SEGRADAAGNAAVGALGRPMLRLRAGRCRTCHPRRVDVALVFIAAEAILLAILLAVAWERGEALDRVREVVGGTQEQLDGRLRSLVSRVDELEWQTSQVLRDVALLADLSGVGV